ncbi:unnamed protein product [Linum tenue]|uniref:RING-type E3 ubiquitin transferase n=1 Tax=Linum tenue TaxID=586396 RepID=A0AAV0HW74_9ROSI|nr:unnamed protein product [Linum tenue]
MAGMLPGVECARRRRFHQSGGDAPSVTGGTRRPSFCLYTSKHEGNSHTSIPSLVSRQRNVQSQALEDKKLGGAAREAKERLDERLRTQRKWSDSKRRAVKSGTLRIVDARTMSPLGELQTEVWGAKSSRWERLKMMKWKAAATKTAAEQEECTICLDLFRAGDHLVHLPCAHRFHSKCLLPWLVTNAHCPCCRMEIHVEIPS